MTTVDSAMGKDAALPRVSVVMPAFNEERHMPRVLASLLAQTYPADRFEVIVVDNGSTDRTVALAQSYAGRLDIQVLSKIGGSIADVRNYGAAVATGEVLAFLDTDCFPSPDWLEESVRCRSTDLLWGATHFRVPADGTWVGKVWTEFQARQPEGTASFIPSGNLFLHKAAFTRIGQFSAALETSEDVELSERARQHGMRVEAFQKLAVDHEGTPRTLKGFFLQSRWHGKHVLRMFLNNLPRVTHLRVVALSVYTLVLFCACIGGGLLALLYRHAWMFWVPLVMLLLPPMLLALIKTVARRRLRAIPALSALYTVYLLARAAALLQPPARNHR